jgi:altronate hydrolase
MIRGFLIHEKDSVLTLLEPGKTGDEVILIGEKKDLQVQLKEDVQAGHKIACEGISKGDQVIKYGYPIGVATRDIGVGDWVHTHNIASNYDKNGRAHGA